MIRNQSGRLAEDLLDTTLRAEEQRIKRQKPGRKVLQKGGVITVEQARKQLKQQQSYDTKDLERRMKRLTIGQKKQWKRVLNELQEFVQEPHWNTHVSTLF